MNRRGTIGFDTLPDLGLFFFRQSARAVHLRQVGSQGPRVGGCEVFDQGIVAQADSTGHYWSMTCHHVMVFRVDLETALSFFSLKKS